MDQESTAAEETEPAEGEETEGQEPTDRSQEEDKSEDEAKSYDQAYVDKLRRESAQYRTAAKQERERAEQLENEKLSEDERTKKEREDALAKAGALEARVKRGEILSAATGKEITNPNIAAELIDPSKVELDDEGKVTNADELLDELLTRYPDLKAKPKVDEDRPDSIKQVLNNGDRVEPAGAEKSQLKSTEGMSTEEIATALEEGRLRDYLKTK